MMVMVVMMVVKVRMEWNACITCRAIRIPLGILVHHLLIIRPDDHDLSTLYFILEKKKS